MRASAPVVLALLLGTAAPLAAAQPAAPPPPQGHVGHQTPEPSPPPTSGPAEAQPPAGVPPLTDEDRAAAFPILHGGHAVHDDMLQSFVLVDQLEWQRGDGTSGVSWDSAGWLGGDRHRLWFRTEGDSDGGRLNAGEAHALYGRPMARWWDLVVGLRQDIRPGPAQTWAAIGIQGLAPYRFEIEATTYVGAGGRTALRLDTEYQLLLTQRLVLQPRLQLEAFGKNDPERDAAAGLATIEPGLGLRYEFRRELAPYLGITWPRKVGGTADLASSRGERTTETRVVLGPRFWF